MVLYLQTTIDYVFDHIQNPNQNNLHKITYMATLAEEMQTYDDEYYAAEEA